MEGTYWQNPLGMPMMAARSEVSALALMAGWEKERAAMNGDPWLVSVSLMFLIKLSEYYLVLVRIIHLARREK